MLREVRLMPIDTLDLDFTPERVKGIRIALGESQEAFGRRIGVVTNMVHRYEKGDSTPTQGRVLKALLDAEAEAQRR